MSDEDSNRRGLGSRMEHLFSEQNQRLDKNTDRLVEELRLQRTVLVKAITKRVVVPPIVSLVIVGLVMILAVEMVRNTNKTVKYKFPFEFEIDQAPK